MVRVKRTSRQVPTSSSFAGAGLSVTALALTVFLEGSVAKSAPPTRMHNASMDRMVFTFRRLHGESYAPLLFSGRERLALPLQEIRHLCPTRPAPRNLPISFPVILLHRAELLELGLFSYPAAECGPPLSYVCDPVACESRRIGQIVWRNRQGSGPSAEYPSYR